MPRPKKGAIKWGNPQVDKLADELVQWMKDNPDEWMIEKFSTEKGIPYHNFEGYFCERSNYFKEMMSLCLDMKKVRFVRAVEEKKIPPTFGIFASKNELGYRDRQASSDKDKPKEIPTKESVRIAIKAAKDRHFGKPD